MSLAIRLLVALVVLAAVVTALVGLSSRDLAQKQAEQGFVQRIEAATRGAEDELVWEADSMAELLVPLCQHDSFVDRTLLDLEAVGGDVDKLPNGPRIAIQTLVPAQRKALRLDALLLVTRDGYVLGADDLAQVGRRDAELAALLREPPGVPSLSRRRGAADLEVHCAHQSGAIGLVGARRIDPILARVGRGYGVELSLGASTSIDPDLLVRELRIERIPGLTVSATISRQPLFEALAQIDASILLAGGVAVLIAIALAVLLARALSQPIVELARQTREVIGGQPQPVRGRGGRELVELATTFNRAVDELTSMRKRLARTERIAARREVARQVAHEIKNPLAPIQAAVETLRRLRARDDPEFDAYFDEATRTVLGEVHRIKTIVSEFTKYARLPAPTFERVDLIEAVCKPVVRLHDQSADGGATVSFREPKEELPDVFADKSQLVQVLTNLVLNGIEAATPARADVRVVVSLARAQAGKGPPREVVLRVRDNGPGIDPKIADRLFEPYASTKAQGTGLGLAICQTIIHEHGGEIRLDSSAAGATFEVLLPVDGPPFLEKAPTSTGE